MEEKMDDKTSRKKWTIMKGERKLPPEALVQKTMNKN
jgi:hypothetical protein